MQLFEGLEMNTHLESLSLTNVGLNDKTTQRLGDAVEKNSTLRVLKCVYPVYSRNPVDFISLFVLSQCLIYILQRGDKLHKPGCDSEAH